VSLLLLFNQKPYFKKLLATARRLADDGEFAIAVVTAHMAFEVAVEQVLVRLLRARGIDQTLEEALLSNVGDRTFQTRATRDLWAALTNGDRISEAGSWKGYCRSVEARNKAIHAGATVDRKQADASLEAVELTVAHLQGVFERVAASKNGAPA
jgi:HEPN domain-containing protein